ncbi:MAG: hypothetical protein VR70_11515 [Rhodospirillaceae bacterium BRH_c57]|nr:MAG: hypothetical protein VR70_11515 [Rhodospirillaceae bacterium BRH_c57]
MLTNIRDVHIEWGQCDPAGIVFFPRYLEIFDACTGHLFAAVEVSKFDMIEKYGILGIPMVDLHTRFIVPSRFGEVVTIESAVTEWRRSSFKVAHRLKKGDQLCVECTETRVWTARNADDPSRIESRPLPPEVVEKLSQPIVTRVG